MPKNNDLKPVKLPMVQRFNEKPQTEFKNNLDSIEVKLLAYPSMSDLRNALVPFLEATWAEPDDEYAHLSTREKDKIIRNCFEGKALPTALETIGLTFKISGISLQEVTHILRHRNASFSADCSGDKWWSNKAALVPSSIQLSNGKSKEVSVDELLLDNDGRAIGDKTDFYARYQQIVKDAKQLYCDMIDSKKVSIMDARYILPRCLETFYFMRINLKDALAFIHQRIDKQIQPETDNLIAYQMLYEINKCIPLTYDLVDIHEPSKFYIKMARTGKATNLYFPDEDSDKFEWNEKDFIYQCRRDEMNGTDRHTINYFSGVMALWAGKIRGVCDTHKHILEMEYEFEERKDK